MILHVIYDPTCNIWSYYLNLHVLCYPTWSYDVILHNPTIWTYYLNLHVLCDPTWSSNVILHASGVVTWNGLRKKLLLTNSVQLQDALLVIDVLPDQALQNLRSADPWYQEVIVRQKSARLWFRGWLQLRADALMDRNCKEDKKCYLTTFCLRLLENTFYITLNLSSFKDGSQI
jgi:hypothetical protein